MAAGGAPGSATTLGSAVFGVAAEANGGVVTAGSSGASMLVQRVNAAGAAQGAFPAGPGVGRAVAVQPDGKVVVAGTDGGMVVRRFNANGSLDTSFAAAGTARLPGAIGNAVALGPCGVIVVGGSIPGEGSFPRIALARLLADGQPDGSFGQGGFEAVDLGRNSTAKGVAVQSDGKIVVGGEQVPGLQAVNGLIARVNTNGSLDTSFNGSGFIFRYAQNGGANATFNAVAVDASGRILGAGAEVQSGGTRALFVRLTPGGTPDPGFGTDGFLLPPSSVNNSGGASVGAQGIAVTAGGEAVAVGTFQDGGQRAPALWAITPGGQLDTAVGGGGRVDVAPLADGSDSKAVTITPDGTIVAGGANTSFQGAATGFVQRYSGFGAPLAPPVCGNTAPSNPPPGPACTTTCPPTVVTPPPPPPPPPGVKVRATSVKLSPTKLTSRTKAKLTFKLNTAASVTLTAEKKKSGRRSTRSSKSSCKAATSKTRKNKACTYYSRIKGSKKVKGKAGTNSVTFTYKFPTKKLSKGTYRLTFRVTGGNTRKLTFTVR